MEAVPQWNLPHSQLVTYYFPDSSYVFPTLFLATYLIGNIRCVGVCMRVTNNSISAAFMGVQVQLFLQQPCQAGQSCFFNIRH